MPAQTRATTTKPATASPIPWRSSTTDSATRGTLSPSQSDPAPGSAYHRRVSPVDPVATDQAPGLPAAKGGRVVFRARRPAALVVPLAAIVKEEVATVEASGTTGGKAMGAAVKAVRERVGDGADGARIAAAVKTALGLG